MSGVKTLPSGEDLPLSSLGANGVMTYHSRERTGPTLKTHSGDGRVTELVPLLCRSIFCCITGHERLVLLNRKLSPCFRYFATTSPFPVMSSSRRREETGCVEDSDLLT